MTITAKFPGKCRKCGAAIEVGEQIEWIKGVGSEHVSCDPNAELDHWIATIDTPTLVQVEAGLHKVLDSDEQSKYSVEQIDIAADQQARMKAEIQRRADQSAAPEQPERSQPDVVSPGVFEMDGAIYLVTKTKDGERLYAKQLREFKLNVPRVLEDGTAVEYDCEWEYVRGVVFDLSESDRMDIERAKALSIRYGRCLKCGRRLKARKSVEEGIGPVCRKSFGGAFIAA